MNTSEPIINKQRFFSPVWLLPIIAAALGGWLMIKSIDNRGLDISIHFDEATGIKPGKTKIRYKGLEIGQVVNLTLNNDLQGVNVQASIKPQASSILRSETNFWLVSPRASLTGISGLDTLVSGNYIDMLPGEGSPTTHFKALKSAPALNAEDGLSIRLNSDSLGSLSVGTAVYFKQIKVGEVHDFKLSKLNQVTIDLVIEKQYAALIKQDSRFWNISGFQAKLSVDGLQVQLGGLSTLISGGIAFDSPEDSKQTEPEQDYTLYPSLDASQRGIEISLSLPKEHGLKKHSKLIFNDLELGEITQIYLDKNTLPKAKLLINPMAHDYFKSTTQIYLLKPQINLNGLKNLANIITGNNLGMQLGLNNEQEQSETDFVVSSQAPQPFEGKKLTLSSPELKNIQTGSNINYLGYKIGQVLSTNINKSQTGIDITILIDKKYPSLLSGSARFYINSPLAVNASLEGINIESGGFDSFVSGQIVLIKPRHLKRRLDILYPSKETALLSKKTSGKNKIITLSPVGEIKSIFAGAKLYYKGLEIGQVIEQKLNNNQLQYRLEVLNQYQYLVKHNSIFWYKAAVAIDASLSQVRLEVAPLSGLIKGGIEMAYLEQVASNNSKADSFPLFSNYDEATLAKTAITLLFDDVRGISQGALIRYRGLTVGKIEQFWLSFDTKKVQAKAHIYKKYQSLFTHGNSHFWIVEPKVALTGVKNLDTFIKGAFIQAHPGNKTSKSKSLFTFKVASQAPLVDFASLKLQLTAKNKASIDVGSPILFRQLQVGLITKTQLSANSDHILFVAEIMPEYSHLIRSNSQFWNVSGIDIDIGLTGGEIKAESLETIITGGIAFSSPNGLGKKVKPRQRFTIHQQAQEEWLEWDPKIKK